MSLTEAMQKVNAAINREPAGIVAPARRTISVFISFSSENADIAAQLADDLERDGFSVWWSGLLGGGEDFTQIINRQLDAAEVVVVLWSQTSVGRKWVISEATRANDQQKLVPVRLDMLETRSIPMPFANIQTPVLSDRPALLTAIERTASRNR